MDVDYKAASFYLDLAQWGSIVVLAVWGYLRSKDTDNAKAVAAVASNLQTFQGSINSQIINQGTRLTVVEAYIEHIPTHEDHSALREEVATLSSDVNGMKQLLERVEHQTNLIHDHLLNKR